MMPQERFNRSGFRVVNGMGFYPGEGTVSGDFWDNLSGSGSYGDFWDKLENAFSSIYAWIKKLRPALAAIATFIPAIGPAINAGLMVWMAVDKMYQAYKKGDYAKAAAEIAEKKEYIQNSGLGALGDAENKGAAAELEFEFKALAAHNSVQKSKGKPIHKGTYRQLIDTLYKAKKGSVLKANNDFAKEDLRWEYQKYDPRKNRKHFDKYMYELYENSKHDGEYIKQRYSHNPSSKEIDAYLLATKQDPKSIGYSKSKEAGRAFQLHQRGILDRMWSNPDFIEELSRALSMYKPATNEDQEEHGDEAPWKVNSPAFKETERIVRKFFALADMNWLEIPRYVRLSFKEVDDTYYNFTKRGTQKIVAARFANPLPATDALVKAAQDAQLEMALSSLSAVAKVGRKIAARSFKVRSL